jgi:hypothetical protein
MAEMHVDTGTSWVLCRKAGLWERKERREEKGERREN